MQVRAHARVGLLVVCAVLAGSCQRLRQLSPFGGGGGTTITLAELPPDPLAAAHLVGEAAATEKDPERLAGLMAAFMKRLKVPVVNAAGSGFLVPGYVTNPPGQVILFEPLLLAAARANTRGDARRLSVIAKAFAPRVDQAQLRDAYLGRWLMRSARDIERQRATTADALLVVALATELNRRQQLEAPDPRVGPMGTVLVGLWLMTGVPPFKGPPPADRGRAPRPGAKARAPLKGAMKDLDLEALGGQMSLGDACAWAAKARSYTGMLAGGLDGLGGAGKWLPGKAGKWGEALSGMMEPWKLAETIMQGLAGMGIAAMIEVDGEVDPKKTRYGGPTEKFTVKVRSENPLSKKEMDKLVDCLMAVGGAAYEELRKIPPKGPYPDAWVIWTSEPQIHPTHGTFTAKVGGQAQFKPLGTDAFSGMMKSLTSGLASLGVNKTDESGEAKAEFKPKDSKEKQGFSKIYHVTVDGTVMPFEMGTSAVYMASNLISNRQVNMPFELEVPLPKKWILELTEDDLVTGSGIQGGWNVGIKARIPFTIDENLRFEGSGEGTWKFDFKGGMGGLMRCEAPVSGGSLSAKVNGNVQSVDTMIAQFNLSGHAAGGINSALKCTINLPGYKVKPVPLQGPAGTGETITGPLKQFTMPLEPGGTKTFTYTENKGTAQRFVTAKVVLQPQED